MAEFIEVTRAKNDAGPGEARVGTKVLVDVGSAIIEPQEWSDYSRMKTSISLPDERSVRVEESYDSIKETLRAHGVNVFSVLPVDSPQQVIVPRAWLEAVRPVLEAWCQNRTCDADCPLGIDDVCVQKELPRLIRGEIHA